MEEGDEPVSEFEKSFQFWTDGDRILNLDIHTAASIGDLQYIQSVSSKLSYDEYNTATWTPLMYAAYLGHRGVTNFLLSQKCSVSKKNNQGRTALMLAVMCGNLELLKDILAFSSESRKALHIKDLSNFSALTHAVHTGHTDVAEFLLQHGADPNLIITEKGLSMLMLASSTGCYDLVESLLQYNADMSLKSRSGDTALSLAVENGHSDIAQLLRQYSRESSVSASKGPQQAAKLLMENNWFKHSSQKNPLSSKPKKSGVTVDEFLESIGLEKYSEIFREQEIDFDLLLSLNDQDLKQIGIKLLGPRKKILTAIERIKKETVSSKRLL